MFEFGLARDAILKREEKVFANHFFFFLKFVKYFRNFDMIGIGILSSLLSFCILEVVFILQNLLNNC